jgi:hypothetical protein
LDQCTLNPGNYWRPGPNENKKRLVSRKIANFPGSTEVKFHQELVLLLHPEHDDKAIFALLRAAGADALLTPATLIVSIF